MGRGRETVSEWPWQPGTPSQRLTRDRLLFLSLCRDSNEVSARDNLVIQLFKKVL